MYGVFLPELEAAYRALLVGRAPSLPELPIQYADFAVWQQEQLTDQQFSLLN